MAKESKKLADRNEIATYIKTLLARYTHRENIKDTDNLITDINISQMNLVDLVFTIEDEFGIKVDPEGFNVETVGDLIDFVAKRVGKKKDCRRRAKPQEDVEGIIKAHLYEVCGVEETSISPALSLRCDLGLDSLDEINLILVCEQKFKISFDDTDPEEIKTVGDLVEYIKQRVQSKVSGEDKIPEEEAAAPKEEQPEKNSKGQHLTGTTMIIRYVAILSGVDEESISDDTSLEGDLSLDVQDIGLIMAWCEDNFGMEFPASAELKTVGDILSLL